MESQIRQGKQFISARYKTNNFILYFQAFSNTNAPIEVLKKTYDYALSIDRDSFRELIISTRPDCLDDAKIDLIASYQRPDFDVWMEVGLQSTHNVTLHRIHRGHTRECFDETYVKLKQKGLKVSIHIIFGLPGENESMLMETIQHVADLHADAVKIHNLHIPKSSPLATEFLLGETTVPGPIHHCEYVIKALERLPPTTIIQRLTCDTPAKELLTPRSFWPKSKFIQAVVRKMQRKGTYQGRLYS